MVDARGPEHDNTTPVDAVAGVLLDWCDGGAEGEGWLLDLRRGVPGSGHENDPRGAAYRLADLIVESLPARTALASTAAPGEDEPPLAGLWVDEAHRLRAGRDGNYAPVGTVDPDAATYVRSALAGRDTVDNSEVYVWACCGRTQTEVAHEGGGLCPLRTTADTDPPPSDDMVSLLMDLVDPDPCSLDHHGYCQAHVWLERGECPNARGRRVIDEHCARRASGDHPAEPEQPEVES